MLTLSSELTYLLLIVGLMVIPRAMQRYRIPAPLTSFAIGMGAATVLLSFGTDRTLSLLATLGISSLFLFAGLEVDLDSLRKGKWPLLSHLVTRSITVLASSYAAMHYMGYSWQVAALLALALLTPSTGLILNTLSGMGLNEDERFWVTIKAIGGELLALAILFVVLQSDSIETLAWSSGYLVALIAGIPLVFLLLGRVVAPYAPGSEFSLLVMVGVISAYLTYQIGVYYLVGAFLAGFFARLLRRRLPKLASEENLHAIQMFASFFVPFYFFYRGLGVPSGAFTLEALELGALITAVALPLRIGSMWLQRRFIKGETSMGSLKVATALTPTLIFTLVLATILHDRFNISDVLYGALLIYAAASTLLPSLILSKPINFEPVVDKWGPPKPTPDIQAKAQAGAEAERQTAAQPPLKALTPESAEPRIHPKA